VQPDGRLHVTPLRTSTQCVLTTGCNALGEGLDLVVEGDAVRLTDDEPSDDAMIQTHDPDGRRH
jgi:nicotinamidase-related amidase